MNRYLFSIIFSFSLIVAKTQTFEGWILFHMEMQNPNPEFVSDSLWQATLMEQTGGLGYLPQKYFYKGENYISEIQYNTTLGYQAYNPDDGLLYSWKDQSDTAITVDSKKFIDEFISFEMIDEPETILGIPCQAAILKSKMGESKIWFNKDYFKLDPTTFQEHVYGHWNAIVREIQCLPLKYETHSFMVHTVQTAQKYEEVRVDVSKFEIPEFKTIIENPMN